MGLRGRSAPKHPLFPATRKEARSASAGNQIKRCSGSRLAEFLPGNGPYGEHDFDSFDIGGTRVFWKIDYLERGTPYGAENPTDNARTCQMVTIMLAEEY